MGSLCPRCRDADDAWKIYVWLCRVWGIMTAISLWGIAIETAYHGHLIGLYLLVAAAIVTFLEILFAFDICVTTCVREERHRGFIQCWQIVIELDHWRRGAIYLLLAAGCFPQVHIFWLPAISGGMLLVSSVLYFIKTVKVHKDNKREAERAKNQTYDRFDEIQDDIEDNGLGTMSNRPIFTADPDTVAEQEEILEV